MSWRRLFPLLLAALLAVLLVACGGGADVGRAGGGWDRIPAIVRDVEPSVVAVLSRGGGGEGEGSGVIVREDGLIVTNAHVVEDAGALEVAFASGDREPAELIAADARVDLALLRIARNDLPAARFSTRTPVVGELAIAVGNPLGFENSATAGIVSGLNRSIPSGGLTPALVDLIQTDAAISPGNSGGALVGPDGQVIGLNVAYLPPEARAVSIGFAIPARRVEDAIDELLSEGRVREAFLGVVMTPLSPEIAEQFGIDAEGGAIVDQVAPGSPADDAGIGPGDLLVGVNGRPIEGVEQVLGALRRSREGDVLRLSVIRGPARLEVPVRVEER
jgi:serine protease DegQ